jgi:hypothetical protein
MANGGILRIQSDTTGMTLSDMHIRPPFLRSQHGLIALVAGVTWLALIGGVLSSFIIEYGTGHTLHSLPSYAAYDRQSPAPTSFGTLQLTQADMVPADSSVQVDLAMSVINAKDSQVDAPRIEDLRLLNSTGDDLKALPKGWSGPAVLVPHSSGTIVLQFQMPQDVSPMWLEYRDPFGQWPIRIALGTVSVPQAAVTGNQ